jgi:predicted transcriptional regulator
MRDASQACVISNPTIWLTTAAEVCAIHGRGNSTSPEGINMKVGEHCKRAVVSISADASITDAAVHMRDGHVGFLIVHAPGDAARKPIGVLTDRDIVLEVVACEVEPKALTVGDVMSTSPVIAHEEDDMHELLDGMRMAGVRRMPVVNRKGELCGVIAADDALELISALVQDIAGASRSERGHEWRARKCLGAGTAR